MGYYVQKHRTQGENHVQFWTRDDGVVSSMEASHLETSHGWWQWWWWDGPCVGVDELFSQRVLRQGAEGPWVLDVFSCYASCSGDLDDGWMEVMLSKRVHISESLAEE